MQQITIPLDDIVVSIDEPVDLAAMRAEEREGLLRDAYSFLPGQVEVSVDDRAVTISVNVMPPNVRIIKLYQ